MTVTDKVLHAAVRKAVELKLLPKTTVVDVAVENWQRIKSVVEAALTEADDECEARLDRARAAYDALHEAIEVEHGRVLEAEAERDAITRLCYGKVETEDLDRETYYRLSILHLCLQQETYNTEPEAIAAVRKIAGLDTPPNAEDRP